MRQRAAKLLRAFTVLLIIVSAIVGFQSPATASPAEWERSLGVVNTPIVLTHPSGAASVGGASLSDASAIQTVEADNSDAHTVATGLSPAVATDTGLWDVDAAGNVYTLASQTIGWSNQTHVVAYSGETKLWDVVPPDTCSGQLDYVQALKLGVDGNVYIVSHRQMGCTGQEFFLTGLDKDDGSTLFSVSLGGSFSAAPNTFFTYDDGVAVLSGPAKKVRYYSYAGVLLSESSLTLTSNEWVGGATATHQGRIYVTMGRYRSTTQDCPYPWTSENHRVEVFDESGVVLDDQSQPLKYDVQPCAVTHAQATPTGVTMIVRGYGLTDRVLALNADMQGQWDAPFDSGTIAGRTFMTWLGNDLTVDNNGNIVTLAWYSRNNQQYRGAQITVLDGANGVQKSVVYTDQLDPNVSFRVVMAGLAEGRLYIPASVCGSNQCSSSSPVKLYAVPVDGLGMDYPRARVRGIAPTTQTSRKYVALGDSFSAGYGIEPYATSGCSRSELAYPKLLDEMPELDLQLSSFVACTGAETWHIENGKDGEVSQLNALSTDTDIVTITIGGNDAEFVDFATDCNDPTGVKNCAGSDQYMKTMDLIQNVLPGRLDGLFGEISERVSSNTRILVLGYPRLMPYNDGTWPNCFLMAPEERSAAQYVESSLNQAVSAAVSRASAQFEFVNADANLNGLRVSPFAGHELCNDAGSYFFGASLPDIGVSFHPNGLGAASYAELVRRYLLSNP